ncbi:glandicoline B O-methyltransferase roqN [Colletotrichum liriopes]|uniref:Glandicoline B O-methyltransferase roqN n=1 Tax=Colletotrichum liriopes TaxID=708192 RepID=A0AA37GHE3_9PEZI|nr:glandicoline B O-methyltransferase roqN [Colletotrichum liriopes]
MATTTSRSNNMQPQSSVKTGGFKVNNGESRTSVPPTQQQQSALNASGDSMNLLEIWRKPIIGELYIRAEYITYPVATSLVEFARLGDVPIRKSPLKVLDMCCGTGVVSSVIQKMMRERSLPGWDTDSVTLTCVDSSQAQLEVIQNKAIQEDWVANEVKQVDVMLPLESFRVTKCDGILATSTWHTEGWVADTRDAIDVSNLALPGQPPVSWPQSSLELTCLWGPGAWESPSFVKSIFRAVGFIDVEIDVVTK